MADPTPRPFPDGDVKGGAPGAIILVRHGEPALSRRVKLSARAYGEWWGRYEEGGLKQGQTPPAELVACAGKAGQLLASTRRRAVESAQAIAGGRAFETSVDLIEAPLPPPPVPSWLRLSPRWWGVISRLCWAWLGVTGGQEPHAAAVERARRVARRLIAAAAEGADVLVVAHGYFNFMVGRELSAQGWRLSRDGGFGYWSRRRFERRGAPAVG
ncbi:MAG: histidine phosphatase family protein [Alphaproteobacteria bacterium]|nr:histidine phosphatase family protein [Alphaproteobacteria bacterium]